MSATRSKTMKALCVACFCEPLLKLMAIGSSKGSDGLWLF
jgi:hypothetical protein